MWKKGEKNMEKNNKKLYSKLKIGIVVCVLLLSMSSLTVGENKLKRITLNENRITVTRADDSGVDLTLSIVDFSGKLVEAEGNFFQRLHIPNGGHTAEYGKAELPTLSFYVAVPQEAEAVLSYEISDYSIFPQTYDIYPSQPPKPDSGGYIDPPFTINESFYSKDEYYPYSVVKVSPIMVMHGCRLVMVSVFPFAYNPVIKELKLYNDISINVDFVGGTGEFISERYRSIYFQPIFDAFLINANCIERAPLHNPKSGILNRGDRADLLIVVYDDFYEEILPLAEWRHLTGIETKVVKWSEIGTTAADLRDYVNYAYYNWELPPSFLLIVGDADHVPVNYLYTHPYHYTPTGTDHWYVAFEGDDYLPELHTGRISVEDEDELTTVVNKILDYSKTPYMDENWFDDVLLAAYEEYGRFFVWTSNTIYDYLNPLGYNCNRQYQGGSPPGSTQGVIDAIDNGVIIANHRDHGCSANDPYYSYTGWSYPQFTTDNIINDIANGEKYPIMFSLNCESGWFDGETDSNSGNWESIGEVGIRVADRGFVSVIASTRVSYSGYNDELCRGFYDGMFPDFDPNYPNGGSTNPYDTAVFKMSQVMNYGKFWMYDKYILPGGCSPYPWTPTPTASRTEFEMFHVHGDPTMEVWTWYPEDLEVEYAVFPDVLQVLVTSGGNPVEGALVCLSQETGIYVKGLTDETGSVELNVEGHSDEEVTLIVTAHNYLYHQENFFLNRPPEIPNKPTGPTYAKKGTTCTFETNTTDFEGDNISYMWDWGDGNVSGWLGPYESGATVTASYAWDQRGPFWIKVKAKDVNEGESDWSERFKISISNKAPTKPWITGRRIGTVGSTYEYSFRSFDLEGDDIYYYIRWGDGNTTSWLGPFNSGYKLKLTHTWEGQETYTLRAKAKDIFGEESGYSTIKVVVPVNQQFYGNSKSPVNYLLSGILKGITNH